MKSKFYTTISAAIFMVAAVLFFLATSCSANEAWTLVEKLADVATFPAHSGVKESVFIKDGKEYTQHMGVYYHSPGIFKFVYHDPATQNGNSFGTVKGEMVIYFPSQKMKMNTPLSKSEFTAIDMIGLKIKPELLKKNFTASLEAYETVLGRECIVIKLVSLNSISLD